MMYIFPQAVELKAWRMTKTVSILLHPAARTNNRWDGVPTPRIAMAGSCQALACTWNRSNCYGLWQRLEPVNVVYASMHHAYSCPCVTTRVVHCHNGLLLTLPSLPPL